MFCGSMRSRNSVKDLGHKGDSYSTQPEQKDAVAGDDDDDATEGEGGECRQRLNQEIITGCNLLYLITNNTQ